MDAGADHPGPRPHDQRLRPRVPHPVRPNRTMLDRAPAVVTAALVAIVHPTDRKRGRWVTAPRLTPTQASPTSGEGRGGGEGRLSQKETRLLHRPTSALRGAIRSTRKIGYC